MWSRGNFVVAPRNGLHVCREPARIEIARPANATRTNGWGALSVASRFVRSISRQARSRVFQPEIGRHYPAAQLANIGPDVYVGVPSGDHIVSHRPVYGASRCRGLSQLLFESNFQASRAITNWVKDYIRNQREHHQRGSVHERWEAIALMDDR